MSEEITHYECDGLGSGGHHARVSYTVKGGYSQNCPVCDANRRIDEHETKINTYEAQLDALAKHVARLNLACKDLIDAQDVREVFQNELPVLNEGSG